MNASFRRTLLVVFVLIALVAWWNLGIKHRNRPLGNSPDATTDATGRASSARSVEMVEEGPSHRDPRPSLPKNAPAAESTVGSSAVHTIIPLGHSMVTGGYQTEDGHHEFVVLTPKWLETPSGKKQIQLETKILNVDQEALLSTGLNSLVTGEQKMQQNGEVWTPEDVAQTLTDTKGLSLISSPSIVVSPGGAAQVRMGNDRTSFALDLTASEASDGGFELKSEIKRVK